MTSAIDSSSTVTSTSTVIDKLSRNSVSVRYCQIGYNFALEDCDVRVEITASIASKLSSRPVLSLTDTISIRSKSDNVRLVKTVHLTIEASDQTWQLLVMAPVSQTQPVLSWTDCTGSQSKPGAVRLVNADIRWLFHHWWLQNYQINNYCHWQTLPIFSVCQVMIEDPNVRADMTAIIDGLNTDKSICQWQTTGIQSMSGTVRLVKARH